MEIIKPKIDVVFKMIFGDERNIDIIVAFVAALLDIPRENIKSIKIVNVEVPNDEYDQKFSRLDLKMEVDNNGSMEIVNIEIQILSEPDYQDRSLMYWSKNFSTQLKSGEPYSNLKKTVCINIINFNLFKDESYRSVFTLMEKERHEILTDKIAIYFFELLKLKKFLRKKESGYSYTPVEDWLNFVNAETEDDLMMIENKTKDTALNKAVVVLKTLNGDEKVKEIARLREKRLHDEASALEYAEKKGMERGLAQGIAQGKLLMLASLVKEGMLELKDAAKILNISEDSFAEQMDKAEK